MTPHKPAASEKHWFSGNYGIEFQMTLEQAESASHSGRCDDDVAELVKKLKLNLDPEKLRKELKEYGAWSDEELSDHAQNIQRIVWLAAGNISDEAVEHHAQGGR